MYNLQATLREITVLDLPVTEITVEVVDVPMFLDLSPSLTEITVEVVDLPLFLDMSADMLPPPPEVVYLDLDNEIDPFPTLSPRDLGLRIDNSILHA
jgi:hypothetical protein